MNINTNINIWENEFLLSVLCSRSDFGHLKGEGRREGIVFADWLMSEARL
jgi:hypothetical protein